MARTKTPVAEYRKLMLRLPEEVHDATNEMALFHHRSLNAQIVDVLTKWLEQERMLKPSRPRPITDDTPAPQPALAGLTD